jgi:membrane protease YdiL (CAAX protease family)
MSSLASHSAPPRHLALFRFTALLLAAAAFEWLALSFSNWTWQVANETLQAVRPGGALFYAPWLVLLLGAMASSPAHGAADFGRPAVRGAVDVALGIASLFLVAGLYPLVVQSIVQGSASLPSLTPALVSGVVFAPVVEEWLFRGVLWRQLAPAGASFAASAVALAATSIAFAYWHLPFNEHAPIALHAAFGATMGLVRWRTGSALPCILFHGLANLLSFVAAGG